MVVSLTTVTGPVYLPDGNTPIGGRVSFELSSWDREVGEALFISGPVYADIDQNGQFSVELFTTTAGVNGVVYKMYVLWEDSSSTHSYTNTTYNSFPSPHFSKRYIGSFALAGAGPFMISDLNIVSELEANSFDVLLECSAYATACQSVLDRIDLGAFDTAVATVTSAAVSTNLDKIAVEAAKVIVETQAASVLVLANLAENAANESDIDRIAGQTAASNAAASAVAAAASAAALGTRRFASFSAAQTWLGSNTPQTGILYNIANKAFLVGMIDATDIPGLPGFIPLKGDIGCFGDLGGTSAAVDTPIWQAAVNWAHTNKTYLTAPDNGVSVISGLIWKSWVRLLETTHIIRGKAPVVITQTAGKQLYGASLGRLRIIADAVGDITATVLEMNLGTVQNCDFSRMSISGFDDAEVIKIGCAPLTLPNDLNDWPIGSGNTIMNDMSFIEITGARIGMRMGGFYGTPTGSEPAGHSPAPGGVMTKNTLIGIKIWDVSECGVWFEKCVDSDKLYDVDVYALDNAEFFRFGDSTYTEQNFVNSPWINGTVAAAEPATTAATIMRFRSWSFGAHVEVEHDIDFFANAVTLIDQTGVIRRCTPHFIGKGNDTSTGNTVTYDQGPAHYLRLASGAVTDPTFSFYDESTTGMFLQSAGVIGFTASGVLGATVSANGVSAANGTVTLPAFRCIGDPNSGWYLRAANQFGLSLDGADKVIHDVAATTLLHPLTVITTTGGITHPSLTAADITALSSPSNGMVLYNATTNKLQVRAAGAWVDLH